MASLSLVSCFLPKAPDLKKRAASWEHLDAIKYSSQTFSVSSVGGMKLQEAPALALVRRFEVQRNCRLPPHSV
jgi:hypothetical protein